MPRIKFLKYALFALLGIIVVRLFVLQVLQYDEWIAKADDQHTLVQTIKAERGDIYMMENGEPVPVVLNQTVYNVIIDPMYADLDKVEAMLLEYAPDNITADFDKLREAENLRYSIVAKKIPRTVAEEMIKVRPSYTYFRTENTRVYPEGKLASSLLGFVNADGVGQYGIEGALNSTLAGTDGMLKTISDVNNVALSIGNDNIKVAAEDGEDVVLTIDRGLQRAVEDILVSTVNDTITTNAAALVMNPITGEVYAMASVPNYDPANYNNISKWSDYLNYTTDVPYEPASVCKTFTFAAALNEGVMTPDSTYYNTGSLVIDSEEVKNASVTLDRGTISMRTVLRDSLNTGSIQALKWLGGEDELNETGRELLYKYYYDYFGLGRKTGIEVSEADGVVHEPNYGWTPNLLYANMTFGQGMNVTMVQVATAFSAVVNGGYMITPTLIKGTMENGELVVAQMESSDINQVITEEVSATMRDLLHNNRSIYSKKDARGYYIGGKSGTGQVYLEETGAYSAPDGETIGNYVGFGGPEGELPKYVVMVKMWGEGKHLSGTTDAKKLFDKVSDATIDYLKIKPKEE